jgi:predicted AAA+ superfamily ATPase
MTAYRRRILDDRLDELQPQLRAISIHGPKGVGKTATASQRAATIISLDRDAVRTRFAAAPERMLAAVDGPILIDEWQRWPESWDVVRHAVDDGAPRGHLILAGSSAPRGATVHSGAGRIVPFRMRPLSLAERGVDVATVSVASLLQGMGDVSGATDLALPDYVAEIVASGFPGIRDEPAEVREELLDAYVDNIIQREFPEQGYPVRKPETLKAWLAAYAAATSTTTAYNAILAAATPGQADKPAKTTTMTYRDALSGLWLLDPVEPWTLGKNHFQRLSSAPKHQLADPALAATLLGATEDSLIRGNDARLLGLLFEHLVTMSIQTYADAARAKVFHLRTEGGGHEVDLILERRDGAILAIEIKLATHPTDRDVRHLNWLRDELGDKCLGGVVRPARAAGQNPPPTPRRLACGV